ncbi:MAG TPA: hypothetical protein VGL29_04565 [Blastocatellia bacterium]|jgi:hypothetical protein
MSNQAFASELEVGIRPLVFETPCRARASKVKRAICQGSLLILLLTTGCNPSQTLFQSNFDATAIDQPPAHQQAVGTVTIDGGVRVAAIPDTNSKGVRFSRISGSNDAVLHCNLSQAPGDSTYVFSTLLFFPSGSGGLVTIQFEKAGGGERFLHLDIFPGCKADDPRGCFRIDDDNSRLFGKYQLDQVFILQVTLNINASSPSAHVVISGAGASGEADRTVSPELLTIARQFGAVRISSGLEADVSTFFATNIVVTRKS